MAVNAGAAIPSLANFITVELEFDGLDPHVIIDQALFCAARVPTSDRLRQVRSEAVWPLLRTHSGQ